MNIDRRPPALLWVVGYGNGAGAGAGAAAAAGGSSHGASAGAVLCCFVAGGVSLSASSLASSPIRTLSLLALSKEVFASCIIFSSSLPLAMCSNRFFLSKPNGEKKVIQPTKRRGGDPLKGARRHVIPRDLHGLSSNPHIYLFPI